MRNENWALRYRDGEGENFLKLHVIFFELLIVFLLEQIICWVCVWITNLSFQFVLWNQTMSYKCAFSSIALHKMRTSRILAVDFAKPALILCNENIGVRYAGHSHWQNIKKTKETKDLAKCKAYSGFVRLLRKEVFRKSKSIYVLHYCSMSMKIELAAAIIHHSVYEICQKF